VSLRLKFYTLPQTVKKEVVTGNLSEGHLQAITSLVVTSQLTPWLTTEQAWEELAAKTYGARFLRPAFFLAERPRTGDEPLLLRAHSQPSFCGALHACSPTNSNISPRTRGGRRVTSVTCYVSPSHRDSGR